jgi:hypothetical protein
MYGAIPPEEANDLGFEGIEGCQARRKPSQKRLMVDVAQLVEPRIVIPVVVGSSPIVHPIFCLGR